MSKSAGLAVGLAAVFGLGAVTTASVDYTTYAAGAAPRAVLQTFYEGPLTRGFAWQTSTDVTEGHVWLLPGTFGAADAAKFLSEGTRFDGTSSAVTAPATRCHRVAVPNLVVGQTYSYRLGAGNAHDVYGTFTVRDGTDDVTILHLSDAQVKEHAKLFMWENTVARAVDLVGRENIDFVLYGGDLYDENAPYFKSLSANNSAKDFKYRMWGIDLDTATPYLAGIPWELASGNHDYTVYADTTSVAWKSAVGGCHAFDYGRVHVAVLPYLGGWSASYNTALDWLHADLQTASAAAWKVVCIHWGPYVTGDHYMDVAGSKDLIRRMAPICASNHVDLVIQGHDHVFTKTLPYRWDGAGYTTSMRDASVVNLDPATALIGGERYDVNPAGTYYVSCGCAGHRVGENTIYAELSADEKCYTNGTYKIATDVMDVDSAWGRKGDNCSHDLSASMFGVLRVSGETLAYDFYVVATNGTSAPVLYDTLRVYKGAAPAANSFRVTPYVQHPATNAMSLLWFAATNSPSVVKWWPAAGGPLRSATVAGAYARALTNNVNAGETRAQCPDKYRYRHRLTGLDAGTRYTYAVELAGGAAYTNTFRTAPGANSPVRFMYYNDSETKPNNGITTDWPYQDGKYYITQTEAFRQQLARMKSRAPDLYIAAGDLASQGGLQRSWDEFWKHNAGGLGLGYDDPLGAVPLLAVIGNHDLQDREVSHWKGYEATGTGSCENPGGGESALERYLSYFEYEPNGVDFSDVDARDRSQMFHRLDYGPVTFLFLDTNNGDDSDPEKDTNTGLFRDPAEAARRGVPSARSPDFNPGSRQYTWLTNQLADAQRTAKFTFVVNHQCPYSVGYHNCTNLVEYAGNPRTYPTGEWLSARAVRVLGPTLLRYGVDGWFCGHDEMMEHARISGREIRPNGTSRAHQVDIYDMQTVGNGLRGGFLSTEGKNLVQTKRVYGDGTKDVFRSYLDEPAVFKNNVLVSGGVHYAHMEVNVEQPKPGLWTCTLSPNYLFTSNVNGVVGSEWRTYRDVVVLTNDLRQTTVLLR